MNQIIELLSNLFSLTKVASVTLPGLLAAGGLALILWPAIPVDLIPLATVRSVEKLASFEDVEKSKDDEKAKGGDGSDEGANAKRDEKPEDDETSSVMADVACPGERILGRHNAYDQACRVRIVPMTEILDDIKEEEKREKEGPNKKDQQSNTEDQPLNKDEQSKAGRSINPELREIRSQLLGIQKQDTYPQSRKEQIEQQLILDLENQKFSECIDLETSLKGREATENLQLKADLDIAEKQRSSAQDNYLAYLKSNNLPLASRYRKEMDNFQGCITLKRYSVLWNERDILERDRRLTELTRDQGIITARLADPGRLRPRLGFDDFVTGLVNHVVAFILLSLAAAIIVTALDRAVFFGGLFEDLFDGF
jgi:hypothetical protein